MAKHLTSDELRRYAGGDATPEDLLAFDDHISSCEECRSRLTVSPALGNWAAGLAAESVATPAPKAIEIRRTRRRWLLPAAAAAAIFAVWVSRGVLRNTAPETSPPRSTASQSPARAEFPAEWNAEDRRLVEETIVAGALPASRLPSDIASKPSILLGSKEEPAFAIIGPAGELLYSDRPEFRWHPLVGASVYRVEIFDSGFRMIVESPDSPDTSWRPPTPLPRGKLMLWQVVATKGEQTVNAPAPPAAEARFRILDRDTFDRIEKARRAAPYGHLLAAVLLSNAGLRNEALAELDALTPAERTDPRIQNLFRTR